MTRHQDDATVTVASPIDPPEQQVPPRFSLWRLLARAAPLSITLEDKLVRVSLRASLLPLCLLVLLTVAGDGVSLNNNLQHQGHLLAESMAQPLTSALLLNDARAAQDSLDLLRHPGELNTAVLAATLFTPEQAVFARHVSAGLRADEVPATGSLRWIVIDQPVMDDRDQQKVGNLTLVLDRSSLVLGLVLHGAWAVAAALFAFQLMRSRASAAGREIGRPIADMTRQARRLVLSQEKGVLPSSTNIFELAGLAGDFNLLLQKFQTLASQDSLTGLPNRRSFKEALQQALDRAAASGTQLGLLFLDLDNFKVVNDSLGHGVGDELLVATADRLRSLLAPEGMYPARLGGDEFVIVVSNARGHDHLKSVADRIVAAFNHPFMLGARRLHATASIGIALFPDHAIDLDTLERQADSAMYAAKRNGRACAQFYTVAMGLQDARRLELEQCLHGAIERNELWLAYQPKVDLHTGALMGAEALLRWNSPQLGPVSPEEFIPVAEDIGLIVPIGRFVRETAFRQLQVWRSRYAHPIAVAVNVSKREFAIPGFVDEVLAVLARCGVLDDQGELELTESLLERNVSDTRGKLQTLRNNGVLLGFDDFGMGYSAMSYLLDLPITCLKIDRSFVQSLANGHAEQGVVDIMLQLATLLQLDSVGEGIETLEQARFLREAGCQQGQGYLFSPALPPEEFEQFLMQDTVYTWPLN